MRRAIVSQLMDGRSYPLLHQHEVVYRYICVVIVGHCCGQFFSLFLCEGQNLWRMIAHGCNLHCSTLLTKTATFSKESSLNFSTESKG